MDRILQNMADLADAYGAGETKIEAAIRRVAVREQVVAELKTLRETCLHAREKFLDENGYSQRLRDEIQHGSRAGVEAILDEIDAIFPSPPDFT